MPDRALTRESLAAAAADLARRDEVLNGVLRRHGPPPLWERRPGFATLVRIILEQQVSLASGRAVFARLAGAAGGVAAPSVLSLGEGRMREIGLTRQKAAYCMELARAVIEKRLDLRRIARAGDEEARAALTRVKGIGPWTADVYLLMALRRPDVWPAGDVALATSFMRLRGLKRRPGPDALARAAEAWIPWRSVAARMLWQEYLAAREQT